MHLFTKEIDNKLFKQYPMGADLDNQVVVAKIYNPYGRGTWYLLNSDPEDPDYIWAIVDLFDVEAGSVSRSELEELRVPPFNLGLERDIYFAPISAKKLYEGLQKGQQFAEGGETDTTILEDKNGDAWLFPENPDGKDFGIKLADGGETKDDYTEHFTKYLTDKFKGKSHKGWEFSYDSFAGTVSWTRNNIEILATPFYEGQSILPIDMVNAENGDPLYQDSLEFKPSNNLEKDEAKYFELLKPFFMVLDVIVEDNEEEQYMADGGMSNSMEEMYKQMENRNMTIRFKIASIIGVHKALEYLEKDYVISPYKLIQGAVGKGFITIDEIDENLWNEAVSEAEDVDSYYSGSGEGIGSSDMNAFISNMLNGAGIKVGVVDNRYQRMADGGMMAKGRGIYSSDSLYYLQVLKDGEEVAKEKFRAKSLKEAKTISEEEYEEKYISKFGNPLNFIVSEAMADGGMMAKGGEIMGVDEKAKIERAKNKPSKWIFSITYADMIDGKKEWRSYPNYVSEYFNSQREAEEGLEKKHSKKNKDGYMAKGGEVNKDFITLYNVSSFDYTRIIKWMFYNFGPNGWRAQIGNTQKKKEGNNVIINTGTLTPSKIELLKDYLKNSLDLLPNNEQTNGDMIWASPTLRKKYESAFGKDFKPEYAIQEIPKKILLIESYYWNYLLDVLKIEEIDEKAANDWKVAKQVEDGKFVQKGPYASRYMYSPSLNKIREQTESEWYEYGSASDFFADGGMMAKGGMTKKSTFDQKVKSISKSLQGAKVKPKYVSKYGKTYDKAESVEAAKNIAGSIRAKYGE
jgi:hypothetical protein